MTKNAAVKSLQKISDDLFGLMTVSAKPKVSYDKDNEAFNVELEGGNETGLLIGKKGETLSSIQSVLSLILKQEAGEWFRVIVNVGDYREKEEDYLKNLAEGTVSRLEDTGEPQSLYNLKPWQRRVIHLYLSDKKGITTESQGEGDARCLVIKQKNS